MPNETESLIDSRTFPSQPSSVSASFSASCSDVLVMRPWRASPSRPTDGPFSAGIALPPSLPQALSLSRLRAHAPPPPAPAACCRASRVRLAPFDISPLLRAILTPSFFAPTCRHLSAARHAEPQRDRQPHRGRGWRRRHRQRGAGSDGHRWAGVLIKGFCNSSSEDALFPQIAK